MANDKSFISGAFGATGDSDTLTVRGVQSRGVEYAWLIIQGTFVGTIVIQINRPGRTTNWVTMDNGSFTAPTSKVIELPANCDVRVSCTAYTSGSAEYQVAMD